MGMYGPEDPRFTPSSPFARPAIQHLSVLKTLLSPPNRNFLETFKLQSLKISAEFIQFQAPKWAKLQFTRLHFVKKFSSQGSQIQKWSLHKPLCSGRTPIPKRKLSAPSSAFIVLCPQRHGLDHSYNWHIHVTDSNLH